MVLQPYQHLVLAIFKSLPKSSNTCYLIEAVVSISLMSQCFNMSIGDFKSQMSWAGDEA